MSNRDLTLQISRVSFCLTYFLSFINMNNNNNNNNDNSSDNNDASQNRVSGPTSALSSFLRVSHPCQANGTTH